MGSFSGPSAPPPVKAPPPPPEAPTPVDDNVTQVRDDSRRRARAKSGYNSTILTGELGEAQTAKTILG